MKVTAPKGRTVIISFVLFLIGIILSIMPFLGVASEYEFYLYIGGLILIIIAWFLLFLGTLITGI